MKLNEINIINTESCSDRFDSFEAYIASSSPSNDFIRVMLSDNYDSIRAECLDFISSKKLFNKFFKEICTIIENENSDFVFGRLYVLVAFCKIPEFEYALSKNKNFKFDSYNLGWMLAGSYFHNNDISYLTALYCLSKSQDYRLSSICESLLLNIGKREYRSKVDIPYNKFFDEFSNWM